MAITVKLENDKRKLKEEYKRAKEEVKKTQNIGDTPEDDDVSNDRIYNETDMASFVSYIEDLWHDEREEDDDVFYNDSLNYIEENLGKDAYIVAQYKKFREEDPYADSHMLKEYLTDLLNDIENY